MPTGVYVRTSRTLENLRNYGFQKGHISFSKGRNLDEIYGDKSLVIREKMRIASKRRYIKDKRVQATLAVGRELSNKNSSQRSKFNWSTPEFRDKMRESRRKWLASEEGKAYRKRVSLKMKHIKKLEWANINSVYRTDTYRKSISEGRKRQWQNPESVRKWMLSNRVKPNRKEIELLKVIQAVSPNTFAYNGDARFGIVIFGKTPDYININGKKQIIELFGNWWHSKKKTGREPEESENILKTIYKQFGFDCLIVWERELSDKDILKEKLREFICKE